MMLISTPGSYTRAMFCPRLFRWHSASSIFLTIGTIHSITDTVAFDNVQLFQLPAQMAGMTSQSIWQLILHRSYYLFGGQVTKQYLSESITYLDYFIFAMAPMGILTAVVSAIRVCGGPSLRAFIGRGQEGGRNAEVELCSSKRS